MKTTDQPIIVEQIFNCSAESVWNAITVKEQMIEWYFNNIPDFKAVPGFETRFNIHNEGRNFLHIWKVTEVEPFKRIKYTWEFEGYQGKSTSDFEIIPDGNKTKLCLTVDVLENFQEDIPEFKRDSCIAGWDYFIKNRLKNYLENR